VKLQAQDLETPGLYPASDPQDDFRMTCHFRGVRNLTLEHILSANHSRCSKFKALPLSHDLTLSNQLILCPDVPSTDPTVQIRRLRTSPCTNLLINRVQLPPVPGVPYASLLSKNAHPFLWSNGIKPLRTALKHPYQRRIFLLYYQ